ncbi:MAG: polysaccharide biosynthesis/export family protein, partial [Cytophagales bacterium]|nr:polysaccharide biosynthesis/export family protein [Cytophagales bacterium]
MPSGTDINSINSVNIDDLSDEQVQSFVDKYEEAGYTWSQVEKLAKIRGVKSSQLSKMKARIRQLGASSRTKKTRNIKTTKKTGEEEQEAEIDAIAAGETNEELLITEKEEIEVDTTIFGASIFNSPTLTFEPGINIPTPQNYQIGVGDELLIDIWGASQQTYQLSVEPSGNINIDGIGPVHLNG